MNSVKSKNSHRNRLLQLLVDQQSEQENIEAQSKPIIMDDELGFDDTDDYEQIMRSNFSMCTSTFANYGESGGGGSGGGGGGGGTITYLTPHTISQLYKMNPVG